MNAPPKPAADDMDALTWQHSAFVDVLNDSAMALQDAAYHAGRLRGFQEGASADVVELRGQLGVFAGLLRAAVPVLLTIEAEDSHEYQLIGQLIEKSEAALQAYAQRQAAGG